MMTNLALFRVLALALLASSTQLATVLGAQSASEDSKGSTTVGMLEHNFGVVQFNAADGSIGLKFGRKYFREGRKSWLDLDLSAGAQDDIASLFQDGGLSPDARAQLQFGHSILANPVPISPDTIATCQGESTNEKKTECIIRYLTSLHRPAIRDSIQRTINRECTQATLLECSERVLRDAFPVTSNAFEVFAVLGGGANAATYRTVATTETAFDQQIETHDFLGGQVDLGLNFWLASFMRSSWIGGLSLGIAKKNNAGALSKRDIEETTTSTSPDGSTQRTVIRRLSAYQGEFEEFTEFPAKLDLMFVPHAWKNIGVDMYSRARFNADDATGMEVGIGFIALQKANPLAALGGIFFSVDDVLSDEFRNDSFFDQVKINLVVNLKPPRLF